MNTAKLLDLRNLFTSQYGTRNSRWLWILKSSTVLSPWLTMPKLLNPVFMVQTYIFVAWTSVFLTQWHDRTVSSLPQVGKRTRFKQPHTHTHIQYLHEYVINIYIYTHTTWVYLHLHMQLHANRYVCMYVCMHACMCLCVCVCVCICVCLCVRMLHIYEHNI